MSIKETPAMRSSAAKKTLKIYLRYILRYRLLFAGVLFILPTIILAESVLVPLLAANILDLISAGKRDFSDYVPTLIKVVGLEIYALIFWRVLVRLLWILESNVMRDLSNDVFEHLMAQSYGFHTNRFGGALVSQTNKFVSAFERLFDTAIFNIGTLFWNYIFVIVILLPKAPAYVVALLTVTLVFVGTMSYLKGKERPLVALEARADTATTAQLADSITNVATVKSFAHESSELQLFKAKTEAKRNRSLDVMRLTMKNELVLASISRSLNVIALVIAIVAVIRYQTPIGIVFLIMSYTMTLLRRIWEISNIFKNINRSFGDAQDMTLMLGLEAEIKDRANPQPASLHRGDILIDKISYTYPGKSHKSLFENLYIHIKPGEKVGLVGHSGSGKTTLSKLLLRLMDIQQGAIYIDGQDIAKIRQTDLRKAIAYVSQEPIMFHRTIEENIRYGDLNASKQAVLAAAKMANAHDFIEQLPHGYRTLVGERGTKLSGGQRQRIAIARAMLKNAPVLLLDEATSALDSQSEQLIQEALWKLMEGRTAIVIAHRLSTIQKMDRIIVMDNGKIAEQGTHKELIIQNGAYANLWRHQSGGFLEE